MATGRNTAAIAERHSYHAAGPGTVLGLQDLLLERALERSIVAVSDITLWRVPSKALKAILRSCPDLSLHLFRLAFGQLEARTELLQVQRCLVILSDNLGSSLILASCQARCLQLHMVDSLTPASNIVAGF